MRMPPPAPRAAPATQAAPVSAAPSFAAPVAAPIFVPFSAPIAALLAALLLPAAGAQAAEWTRIGRGANPAIYVDLASVKENDDGGRSAWILRTYSKGQTAPDGKAYRSVRAQHLYACKDHTATLQAQAFYPDAMGNGEAVGNFKYEQYDAEKIAAGSAMDSVSKRVCRKKLRKPRR